MNDPTALCDFIYENINIYSGFQRAIFAATCHILYSFNEAILWNINVIEGKYNIVFPHSAAKILARWKKEIVSVKFLGEVNVYTITFSSGLLAYIIENNVESSRCNFP